MSTLSATYLKNASVGTNTIELDSSGNVKLAGASNIEFRITSGTTSDLGDLTFYTGATQRGIITGSSVGLTAGTTGALPLLFITGNTERTRIDSSGRLLVGTSSSPSAGDGQYARLVVQGNTIASSAYVAFARNEAATSITANEDIALINFTDNAGNTFGRIECYADASAGSGDYPGRLVFSTTADGASSPTERMRIESNGRIKMQADATVGLAAVELRSGQTGGNGYYIYALAGTSGNVGGTNTFQVVVNGNVLNSNGSYTAISDSKLKENIVDANSQWNDLKSIRIRNWNFKADTGYENHRQIGPIAQELETVCPGLVFETPDRDADGNETGEVTKGVNQSVLYMKAVKALQEAMERIETLEAKVAALETP